MFLTIFSSSVFWVSVGLILCVLLLYKVLKKPTPRILQIEDLGFGEFTDSGNEVENTSEVSVLEEIKPIPRAWEFEVDSKDGNLFNSLTNPEFSIRVIRKPNLDYKEFSLSLPCGDMTEIERQGLLASVPQIEIWGKDSSHTLSIKKSGAVSWDSIENKILGYLFKFLDKKYSWQYEKQTVLVSGLPNCDILSFNLRIETRNCLDLGRALYQIRGIVFSVANDGIPLCMNHEGNYRFSLEKASAFSWDELRPEIEKVFQNFFPGSIEFAGIWEKK